MLCAEIEKFFNPALIVPDSHETEESPSGNYHLESDAYEQDDPTRNWVITAVTVTDRGSGKVIVELKSSYDMFFLSWIGRNGVEYLIYGEDLEGQTVIDLTNRKIASYSSDDDRFIWTEFHLSPSKSKLAVIGCYWECPSEVVVYDFNSPPSWPLKRLSNVVLDHDNSTFDTWIDEYTLRLKNKDGTIQIHKFT